MLPRLEKKPPFHQRVIARPLIYFLIFFISVSAVSRAETDPAAVPTPSPAQQTDRKSDASGAENAAKAAAIIAAAMCAAMMAQAMQMPPGPEKTQLMTQAMQQCAQAAQNAAAGDKNEQAKNAVAQNDTSTGKQDTSKKSPSPLPAVPQASPASAQSNSPSTDSTAPATSDSPLTDPGTLPNPAVPSTDFGGGTSVAANGTSTLKPIEDAQAGFNENNKGDEKPINLTGGSGGGSFGTNTASIGDSQGNGKDGGGNGKNGKGSGKGGGSIEGESGGADSKTADAAAGKSAFDQIMASMMGGSPEPVALMGGLGADILNIGKSRKAGNNIFQVAKKTYQKAAYNDGILRIPRRTAALLY